MEITKYLKDDYVERLRNLLENFALVSTRVHMALVSGSKHDLVLRQNVDAAVTATTLGNSGIDYTKKQYCPELEEYLDKDKEMEAYTECYFIAKNYFISSLKRLKTTGEPTVGVFGSSLVLERLQTSLFSAHLLYKLGHRYEGHAVSRLMLEQIAWAYSAYPLTEMDQIKKVSSTKSIGTLKNLSESVGPLYGFLSKKTHIDYNSHNEFLGSEDEKNVIFHTQRKLNEYAYIILKLADLMVLVWEISQHPYLSKTVAVKIAGSSVEPDDDREFLVTANEALEKLRSLGSD